ncbi:Asp-tRNA(Asn)/Glu-tRNA(Gln) amidotransferase subunit GatB [uncultured Microscilla sp.]|uniref:Asp-tRNA(Asn)/Glu-tRNA(Gln) amidotransferase subunit GatB n=1 Tax=uncultured Microscilla sp. TaxID=432653 RepID=UPI00260943D6|nr:Asp-tRNA(Asn)/Glu-tRNA(Gln) amidotransferase subunit GatB [uncultured Microscilla sp.]
MPTLSDYEVVIGLEVHVQLQTQSKIFSGDANQFSTTPNTNISAITLAHPGTLPKLNRQVVAHAIKIGLACGCHINQETIFARKNYFYPDLPKGYQISQDKAPICEGGKVEFVLKDGKKAVMPLTRIHMEEDAGKSSHPDEGAYSWVDYNRAGTPLVEIVTDPVVCHPNEAAAFAYGYFKEIRKLVQYLEICDGKMEQGSLRCDANVSLMPKGSQVFGQRTEVKNLNSMRNVQRAVTLEIERQFGLLSAGEQVLRQTLNFDAQKNTITAMRSKEEMNDYRYFPDPDLAPVMISDEWLQEVKQQMPALPQQLQDKLMTDFGLSAYDAEVITEEKALYAYFAQTAKLTSHYKLIANWLMGDIKEYLNQHHLSIEALPVKPAGLAQLITLIESGKLSHTIASRELFPLMLKNPEQPAEALAQAHRLVANQDADELSEVIKGIIAQFPKEAKAYKQGKKKLKGMFMGQVMKQTGGKADPKLTTQLLDRLIAEVE